MQRGRAISYFTLKPVGKRKKWKTENQQYGRGIAYGLPDWDGVCSPLHSQTYPLPEKRTESVGEQIPESVGEQIGEIVARGSAAKVAKKSSQIS